jgi:hypothetical protein
VSLLFTVETKTDPARWDTAAEALNGTAFHCHAWGGYRARLSRAAPLYASWRDAHGSPAALSVGWLRRPSPGISLVEFDAEPARREDADSGLAGQLVEWARAQKAVELRMGSFGFGAGNCGPATADHGRVEFMVEPGDADELRKRMRKGARSSISRARRLGIQALLGGEADVTTFVDLHEATLRRLRDAKLVRTSLDGEALADALGFLVGSERARLYVARQEGLALCGCLFACFGRSAYYLLNGATEASRATGAGAYLLHFALADLSAAGYSSLNLGGAPSPGASPDSPHGGVYEFKAGLGGIPKPCPADRRVTLRPVLAAVLGAVRKLLHR